MRRTTKLLALILGIAVLVGILGIGVAFSADPTPTTAYHDVFVAKVAQILGKPPAEVDSALTEARTETIDQMVKDGRITQRQADLMKQRQEQMQQGGFGPGMMGAGHGGRMGGRFGGAWGTQAPSTSSQ